MHALRVGLVAARKVALVGPLVGVQHPVLGQRLLARQRLAANVANLKMSSEHFVKSGNVFSFYINHMVGGISGNQSVTCGILGGGL